MVGGIILISKSKGYRVFEVFNVTILILVVLATLLPFLYVFSISLSSNLEVLSGKVSFYPKGFTTEAYKQIVAQKNFWLGYKNTIIYTVSGTLVSLFMSTICAYPLSKKHLMGRQPILMFMVFTMYFGGGLIPSYLLIKQLHWINSIWALIIPGSISTYNMLVMKTFFEGIPQSLEEAAAIDGMNQIGILVKIILPLSKPILATMTLFYAVGQWNEWFSALIYLNSDKKYPVTLFLRNIVMGAQMAVSSGQAVDSSSATVVPQTLQSATIMLVTIPILCVYPFVQKYFVQGVLIGSIKE